MEMLFSEMLSGSADLATIAIALFLLKMDRRLLVLELWKKEHEKKPANGAGCNS